MINCGVHCALKECNQLDFLPFQCEICEKQFCQNHYLFHGCHQNETNANNSNNNNNNNNNTKNNNSKSKSSNVIRKFSCSARRCKSKEFVKFVCNKCHQNYCVKHRSPNSHQCDDIQKQSKKNREKQQQQQQQHQQKRMIRKVEKSNNNNNNDRNIRRFKVKHIDNHVVINLKQSSTIGELFASIDQVGFETKTKL